MSDDGSGTLGPVRVFALAAGGMVGGGIYVSLGVVVEAAGQWAWASFLVAGIAATLTAWSYATLTNTFHRGGGAFDFLEEIDRTSWAGGLSWMLLLGYVLTISVYAFAFGNYVANAFGGSPLLIRVLAVGVMVTLVLLNLAGAGKLTSVEVVIVTANLLALLVLAGVGIADWAPEQLAAGIDAKGPPSLLLGAAAIFVAYEGFQLLTYEYAEMRSPRRWFRPVLVTAAALVVVVYIIVALGATMISSARVVVEQADVALAVAAEQALGRTGLVMMTLAAAFATSAAINSTLFSTAKLAGRVADDGELPTWFAHRNERGIPDRAVAVIAGLATVLAVVGSLASLVEAASLVFVMTFAVVNAIALSKLDQRIVPGIGLVLCVVLGVTLVGRLAIRQPIPFAGLVAVMVTLLVLRPRTLAGTTSNGQDSPSP